MPSIRLILFLVFSAFAASHIHAQPGGGGGVDIGGVYNNKLQRLCDDSAFQIRSFILDDPNFNSPIRMETRPRRQSCRFILPPFEDYILRERNSHHRVLITYGKEVMIVDFISAINENGGGVVERIDSIVFQPGHFMLDLNPLKPGEYFKADDYHVRNRGITPSSKYVLKNKGWLQFSKKPDLNFLNENNFIAYTWLAKAREALAQKKLTEATINVNKGLRIAKSKEEKELALRILKDVYVSANDYKTALDVLNNAIVVTTDNYRLIEYLKERIEIFIAQSQFSDALVEYNKAVAIAEKYNGYDLNGLKTERARLKMDHLGLFKESIGELNSIINYVEHEDRYRGHDDFAYYHFLIGIAQYRDQQKKEAFNSWFKVANALATYYYDWPHPSFFDSIINKHPTEPLLYVSRASAYHGISYDRNKQGFDSVILQKALNDYVTAESLGFINPGIHLFKAVCYRDMKNYRAALALLDKAIETTINDIRLYNMRFEVRKALGLVDLKNEHDDPDIKMVKRLQRKDTDD